METKTMRENLKLFVLLCGLLFASTAAHAWGVVGPPPVTCTGQINGGTISTNLIVPAFCELVNVTVNGNVEVERNATLVILDQVKINGNIDANQCLEIHFFTEAGTSISIGGNVSIKNCTAIPNSTSTGIVIEGDTTISGNLVCSDNNSFCQVFNIVVHGNLTVDNNTIPNSVGAENTIRGVQVDGNMDFSGNTGGNVLSGNTIGGNLTCSNNSLAPLILLPNMVAGNTTGQCAP